MSIENRYPALANKVAEAREAGYQDEEIESYLAEREQTALEEGYKQEDVDAFLGRVENQSTGVLDDVGRMFGMGLNQVAGAFGGAVEQAGKVTGLESVEGAGEWIQDKTDSRAEELSGQLSWEQQQAREKKFTQNEEGERAWGEAWKDPRAYLGLLSESAPGTIVGIATGGVLTRAAAKAAPWLGRTGAAALGYGAGEGAVAGTMAGKQVVDEIHNTPWETLAQTEEFRKAYHSIEDESMTHEDKMVFARSKLETAAYGEAAGKTGLVTTILSAPTGIAFDRMLRGAGLNKAAKPKTTDALKYTAGEGLQEAPQGGSEEYISGTTLQKYADPSINPMDNVLEAAVSEGIAGVAMGAPTGVGTHAAGRSRYNQVTNRIGQLEKEIFSPAGEVNPDVTPDTVSEYLGLTGVSAELWNEAGRPVLSPYARNVEAEHPANEAPEAAQPVQAEPSREKLQKRIANIEKTPAKNRTAKQLENLTKYQEQLKAMEDSADGMPELQEPGAQAREEVQTVRPQGQEPVTRKDGTPFTSEAAAKRALASKGLEQTHRPEPSGDGFVLAPVAVERTGEQFVDPTSANAEEFSELEPQGAENTGISDSQNPSGEFNEQFTEQPETEGKGDREFIPIMQRQEYRDILPGFVDSNVSSKQEMGMDAIMGADERGHFGTRAKSANPAWAQEAIAVAGSVPKLKNAVNKAARGEVLGDNQRAAVEMVADAYSNERVAAGMEDAKQRRIDTQNNTRMLKAAEDKPSSQFLEMDEQESAIYAEFDEETKTLHELIAQAHDVADENSIDSLLESDRSDGEIAAELYRLIERGADGRESQESESVNRPAEAAQGQTGPEGAERGQEVATEAEQTTPTAQPRADVAIEAGQSQRSESAITPDQQDTTPVASDETADAVQRADDVKSPLAKSLIRVAEEQEAKARDWEGREYKDNRKTLHYVDGDGPLRNGTVSVGRANENRRTKTVEAARTAAKKARELANDVEQKGEEQLLGRLARLHAQIEQNGSTNVDRDFKLAFHREYMGERDLLESPISKALIDKVKQKRKEQEVDRAARKAEQPEQPADSDDLLNMFRGTAKPDLPAERMKFVERKVDDLGSVEAVDQKYTGDAKIDRYARDYARKVFAEQGSKQQNSDLQMDRGSTGDLKAWQGSKVKTVGGWGVYDDTSVRNQYVLGRKWKEENGAGGGYTGSEWVRGFKTMEDAEAWAKNNKQRLNAPPTVDKDDKQAQPESKPAQSTAATPKIETVKDAEKLLADNSGTDEQLYNALQSARKGTIEEREMAEEAFSDIADFYVDSDNKSLARIAKRLQSQRDGVEFKRNLLERTDGNLAGVQLANNNGTRGAIFLPDASEPGRYRVSFFDEKGFFGHSTRDEYSALLEEAFQDGYRKEDSGIFGRMAAKESFSRGNELTNMIAQVNSGKMTYDELVQKMEAKESRPAQETNAAETVTQEEEPAAESRADQETATRTAWADSFPDIVILSPLSAEKNNPDYEKGKAGDEAAAVRFVQSIVTDTKIDKIKQMTGEADIIVSVHAEESGGLNQIPNALAAVLSDRLGVDVDVDIVQADRPARTGGDGFYRLANQPSFTGDVAPGAKHLILDDTITQGGTLASLKGYIETNGGEVIGAVALTGKKYSAKLAISDDTLSLLREKHGGLETWWKEQFGYGFDRLTESEARYLSRVADADTIRDKILTAKQEALNSANAANASRSKKISTTTTATGKNETESGIQGKIDDFGEELVGARKHYAEKLGEAEKLDPETKPLSKTWPEPNYSDMLEKGFDPYVVGLVHALRDAVPTKGRSARKVRAYKTQLEKLRSYAKQLIEEPGSKDNILDEIRQAASVYRTNGIDGGAVLNLADLYSTAGHENSLKGLRIRSGKYGIFNGKKYDPPKEFWSVESSRTKSNFPRQVAVGETKEQALESFKEKYDGLFSDEKRNLKGTRFVIYTDLATKKVHVGKKFSARRYLSLAEFENVKDARKYLAENQAELEKKLDEAKKIPPVRKEENAPRVGEDHLQGQDVTPEMFSDTFGFRGVQFGNYVEQKKRQNDLNEAYEALMDMAGVLGIPAKAISLNGKLGLAFGARGRGGQNSPNAHYEPDTVVINLTKKRGAGSLAHEWWHALDNYFDRARSGDAFMTERPKARRRVKGQEVVADPTRPEVLAAFLNLMDTINDTGLKGRASLLDEARSKEYWQTDVEVSARAFETYIIEKLHDNNGANDYLANIVSEKAWEAAAAFDPRKQEGAYPYPTKDEMPKIKAAYQRLFDTIESRETGQGVELYSRNTSPLASQGNERYSEKTPDDLMRRMKEQLYVPERIHEGTLEGFGQGSLGSAEDIARRSLSAIRQAREMGRSSWPEGEYSQKARTELRPAEVEPIRRWAEENDLIRDVEEFNKQWEAQGKKGGAEHDVYYNEADGRWYKRQRFTMNETYTDYFQRLILTNMLNSDSGNAFDYRLEGFVEGDGELLPVVSQGHIPLEGETGPTIAQIHKLLDDMGFERVDKASADHMGEFRIPGENFILSDHYGKNVSTTKDGHLVFLDPLIKPDVATKKDRVEAAIMADKFGIDDAFFSSGSTQGTTAEQVEAELKSFLGRGYNRLKKLGKLEVVQGLEDPSGDPLYSTTGDIAGAYRNSKVTLIADQIEKGGTKGLMKHEGLHALMAEDAVFTRNRDKILEQFEGMKDSSPRVKAAFERVPKDTKDAYKTEEALAYFVQDPANNNHNIFRKMLAQVKAFLLRHNIPVGKLNEADLQALVEQGVRSFANRATAGQNGATATDSPTLYSKRKPGPVESRLFDTQEHKAWYSAVQGAFSRGNFSKEKIAEILDNANTAVLDRLNPVKKNLGEHVYRLHRLMGNSHATMQTFLEHGELSWKDQALTVLTKDKGFLPWLERLGDDAPRLFKWMAVRRAATLDRQGRENWLTADQRKALLDELFEGLPPEQRRAKVARFEQLNKEFQKWNRNIIKIAREAGLMSEEQIEAWTSDYYLPFYRIMENEMTGEEFVRAPRKAKQHVSAQIKRLKGGEEKLGDPIENIMRNWSHLIQASQANVARQAAAEVAVDIGVAEEVSKAELTNILGTHTTQQWAVRGAGNTRATKIFDDPATAEMYRETMEGRTGRTYEVVEQKNTTVQFGNQRDFSIVSYQDNGETVYLRINDPDLFEAMSEVNIKAFESTTMKIMGLSKRVLTVGATATAGFRIANLFRDTIHTAMVSKSFTPFLDSAKGLAEVWNKSDAYIELMASGGGFSQGWVDSGDPKAMARATEKIVKRKGEGSKGIILDTPRKMWEFWERIGHASEMAARVQLYKNLRAKGQSHMDAAFEARDLMDFQRSGASTSVRVLTATVPFLNARFQGLNRMYRGAKADPKAFMVKGAMMAGASLMLWSLFKDDERYKELEDWEKFAYHHFWIGDQHFRLPKAFETGALFSTMFEAGADVMSGNEEFDYFVDFLTHTTTQTFAIGMPQLISPIMEVYSNKSAFTGRDIESMALQRLPSGERAHPWTPEMLKDFGKLTGISPVKAEAIIRGYTAAIGGAFLTVGDAMYRHATSATARPAATVNDMPGIGRFVRDDVNRTKYATRYYDFAREVNETVAAVNNYKRVGEIEMARELATENMDSYKYKRFVSRVNSQLAKLRRLKKIIWADKSMTSEEKRVKMDEIQKSENEIYQKAYRMIYGEKG